MDKLRKRLTYIKRNFPIQYNEFIATTSMPGFKFTNCTESSKTQLFFWHIVLHMSLYLVLIMCFGFYDQFENKAVLTVLEVMDQGEQLPFPAVYLCLGYPLNPEKMRKFREEMFKKGNITIPLEKLEGPIQSALRFQRSTRKDVYNLDELFKYNMKFNKVEKYLPQLYYTVDELLKECQLKGKRHRCDTLFKPLETGPGFCFVYNSIYTNEHFTRDPNRIKFKKYSELDEDWAIRFKVSNINTSLLIFLKDPRELLAMTDFPSYIWNPTKNISKYSYTIRNHYAEKEVRNLKESQRKCLYLDEHLPYNDIRSEYKVKFYSQGLCRSYCQAMEFVKYCKCLPASNRKIIPKLSKKLNICSLRNIRCIEKNYSKVRQTDCFRCLPNCNYTEYAARPLIRVPGTIPATDQLEENYSLDSNNSFFDLTIDLEYWPVLHYRTLIIFSTIEYLVSLMGLAGFFLGPSFLTIFEAFYGLFVRFCCSYYVNWDNLEREFRKQEEKERTQVPPRINMSLRVPLTK